MPRALIIEFSLCGVGHDAGPPRTIRLGIVHVSVVPRGFIESVRRQSRAFVACRRVIWLICQRVAAASKSAPASASPIINIDRDLAAEMDEAVATLNGEAGGNKPRGEASPHGAAGA
jgi:hypothetical protein